MKMPRGPKVTQNHSNATNSVNQTLTKALVKRLALGSDHKLSQPTQPMADSIEKIPKYVLDYKPPTAQGKPLMLRQQRSIVSNAYNIVEQASNLSSLSKLPTAAKPAQGKDEFMVPKEAHTITVKNNTKIVFELPIKQPKHTRNANQDQSLLISLAHNSCDQSLFTQGATISS